MKNNNFLQNISVRYKSMNQYNKNQKEITKTQKSAIDINQMSCVLAIKSNIKNYHQKVILTGTIYKDKFQELTINNQKVLVAKLSLGNGELKNNTNYKNPCQLITIHIDNEDNINLFKKIIEAINQLNSYNEKRGLENKFKFFIKISGVNISYDKKDYLFCNAITYKTSIINKYDKEVQKLEHESKILLQNQLTPEKIKYDYFDQIKKRQ
jgi:hypothetical protein